MSATKLKTKLDLKVVEEWVNSASGQKALKAASEKADQTTAKLKKTDELNPKKLDEPITL